MIEKFGYYITNTDKIKVYRIIGSDIIQLDGTTKFIVNDGIIPSSYKYTLKNKVGDRNSWGPINYWERRSYGNNRKWFDTHSDAEEAGKTQLVKQLNNAIDSAKSRIQQAYDQLNDIKIEYHNCGDKLIKTKKADEQVQTG